MNRRRGIIRSSLKVNVLCKYRKVAATSAVLAKANSNVLSMQQVQILQRLLLQVCRFCLGP